MGIDHLRVGESWLSWEGAKLANGEDLIVLLGGERG